MSDIRSSMSSIPEENWNAIDWSDGKTVRVSYTHLRPDGEIVKTTETIIVGVSEDTQEC